MQLTGIRNKVFLDRYALKDKEGKPIESTPEEMWRRIAHGVAANEKTNKDKKYWENEFYGAMTDFKFIPGGRILSGAGTGYKVTYYNCFVIPSPKDSRGGILETLKQMVEIMARGGGVGINLSSLRPRGARVEKVNGFSSGPCNWAELFSVATKDIIQQGGTRRGALMLMLWDWHPDIEEFITVKQDLSRINGANLSVCVSDSFMDAVKNDRDWDLIFPDKHDVDYDTKWDGVMQHWLDLGKKPRVVKTIKARSLWDLICQAAWRSAEPGLVFMERYNKQHSNYYFNYINCVNPCVTGDTLVATTAGLKHMRQLYEENTPFTAIVNGKAYLSTAVKKTGVKPVFRLKTHEGYELRLTRDHKVVTLDGPKAAEKLTPSDKIVLTSGGGFGKNGSLEEGQVLGWLVGDGSMKKDVATLYFYHDEKKELAPKFATMVSQLVAGEQVVARSYSVTPQYVEKENKAVVESVRLWRIAQRYGLTHANKYLVPKAVLTGSEMMQRGYLQGLFSSDGHVAGTPEKGVSARLTSISKALLIDVQRLLLNFGIMSRIYENRRADGIRKLPNGKGAYADYHCQAYHDLVISKSDLVTFAGLIGFLQKAKQEKLRSLLSRYTRGPYRQQLVATVKELEPDGIEEVFDITVSEIHQFSANGLLVLNCGEEGLPAWGVCNLSSINLSVLVNDKGEMDYEELAKIAKISVRFQDNIIDQDVYVFPGIRETQLNGERRVGLGTMGLGDALIKMKIRYGSDESIAVCDKIYKIIRDAAFEASVETARDKKPFPKFNADKYLKGYFIKQLPESIRAKIKKFGIRNSVILMQAPTGSTSLLSGTSSGIEPVYEFEFIRRDRLGQHILRHPMYEIWYEDFKAKNGRDPKLEERPSYFVSANDLTPEDHVKVQAVIQKYVDAYISKTVNAPNAHTVEDVKKLYMMAYDLGCKGVTYMRDGSRAGVLERIPQKKEEAKPTNGHIEVPAVPIIPQVKPRPMMAMGATYKMDTPVGKAYVTINANGGDEPLEVFINVGKAGSDVQAMAEGLGRLISLTLRLSSPLPPHERLKEIIDQLGGIGGSRHVGFGDRRVKSLPDAIAKVMARHFSQHMKLHEGPIPQNNGHTSEYSNGHGLENGHTQLEDVPIPEVPVPVATGQQALFVTHKEFDLCPSCGEAALVHEEGCKKCYGCGYSEC